MSGRTGVAVTISATDAASAKIDAINKRLAAMNAPVERVQKSLAKFADLSGISRLQRGMEGLASSSFRAFESLGRLAPALGAITGAASLAGMATLVYRWGEFNQRLQFAATRAGMSAQALQTLQNSARLAGVSADALTSGVATLGDKMNDALGGRDPQAYSYLTQLTGAFWRTAAGARSTEEVLPKLADAIAKIHNPFTQARVATVLFGGAGEAMLPILRLGSARIAELREAAQRYGTVTEAGTKAALQLEMAHQRLVLSTEGLTNAIGEKLAPVLVPLLIGMAEWIQLNKSWIASDIGGAVKHVGDDVKYLADQFGQGKLSATALAEYMSGGWLAMMMLGIGPVRAAMLTIMAGAAIVDKLNNGNDVAKLPVGAPGWAGVSRIEQLNYVNSPAAQEFLHGGNNPNPFSWWNPGSWLGRGRGSPGGSVLRNQDGGGSTARGDAAARESMAFWQSHGLTSAQAAGMAAQEIAESQGNAGARGDYVNGVPTAMGAYQWHRDRRERILRGTGIDVTTAPIAQQREAAYWELTHVEHEAYRRLMGAQTAREAGVAATEFERPDPNRRAIIDAERGRDADRFLHMLPGSGGSGGPLAPGRMRDPSSGRVLITDPGYFDLPGGSPAVNINQGSGASGGGGDLNVRGGATLNVRVAGPPGTTVGATTSGDLFQGAPRVEQTTVGRSAGAGP